MNKPHLFTLIIALNCLSFSALGQNIELNKYFGKLTIEEPYLYKLNSSLPNEQIINSTTLDWETANHTNFGYSSIGWAKFDVKSTNDHPILLEITSHFIDSVQTLVKTNNTLKEIQPSSIKHKYFLYELNLTKDSLSTIYIRGEVLPGDVLKFGINLWEPQSFYEHQQIDIWSWALFTGLMASILGAVMLINFIKPQSIYIYYGGYILGITAYCLINDGWAIFIKNLLPWADTMWFLSICLNLALFSFLNFTRAFLAGKDSRIKYEIAWFLMITGVIMLTQTAVNSGSYSLLRTLIFLEYALLAGYLFFWILYLVEVYKSNIIKFRLILIALSPMVLYFLYDVFLLNTGWIVPTIDDMLLLRITLIFELTTISLAWLWYNQHTQNVNQELSESNLRLKEEIILLPELERKRIASDLHDSLGGTLSALKHRISSNAEKGDLMEIMEKAITDLKYISLNLQPIELEGGFHLAVHNAIEVLKTLSSTSVKLIVYGDVKRFHFENELNLYRIVSELITNVHKHAQASQATIQLLYYPEYLLIMIEDNGKGINGAHNSQGNGLKNIKDRVAYINGDLNYTSAPSGTTFIIKSPYHSEDKI